MEVLIPIFGIVFLFGAPVAAWIVSRVLAHQERMEMIRHGYMPPPGAVPGPGPGGPGRPDYYAMKAAAKAWKYGGAPMPGMQYDPQFLAQQQLRKGIQVTCVGLALLIGLSFIGVRGDGTVHLGPWLLGGLVPMFVGIAQIIGATIGGARFGAFNAPGSQTTFGPQAAPPPPPAGSPPPPPEPPPAGPYAWRPGPTPEIEKPE